jgi:hypothetical protein
LLATSCNSTVIEICGDKIRVSQRFIGFQISGYTALPAPVALGARIDIAIVFDQYPNMIGFAKK